MASDKLLLFDETSSATRKARERRLNELACTFPSLRPVLQQRDWLDESRLLDLAEANTPCRSSHYAARFVLAIWSNNDERDETPFDVIAVLTVWNEEHRAAFLAWAASPWFE